MALATRERSSDRDPARKCPNSTKRHSQPGAGDLVLEGIDRDSLDIGSWSAWPRWHGRRLPVTDLSLDRTVALKVLAGPVASDPEFQRRFVFDESMRRAS